MRLAAKLPDPAFIVKRISYLASDDTDTLLPSCALHVQEQRVGVCTETLMDNAG